MRSHGKDESRAEKISQNVGLLGLYISGITKACLTIILEVLILGLTYLVDWIRGQSNNNPQNIHDERLNLKKNNKKQQQLIEEDENEEDTFSNDTEELNCGDDQKDQRQSIEQNELLKANSTQHQQKSTVDFPTSKNLESDLQRNSQISDSPVNGSVPLQSNPILSQSPSSETILVNVSTNGKRQSVDHISSTISSTSSDTERQSPPLAHHQHNQQQNNQNSFANPHAPQHLQQQQQHFSVSASVSNSEDEQDRSNSNSDFYEDCREIALKNLSWQLKFDQIQNTLNTLKHAPTKIRFLRDQKSRFSGVVFVKYASAQHALDILSDLQGLRVLDRDVTVELCKYRKKKGKSPATSLTGSRYSGSSSETEIMNSITINNNINTRASNTNSTTTTTTTSNVVPNTGLTPSISIQPMIINSTNNNNNSTKPNIGARTSSMVMPRTTSNYSSSDERGEVKLKKSHSELTPIGMNRNRTNSASAPISETNTPANNNINNNNTTNNNTSPTSVSQMAFDLSPIQIPFIQQQQMPQQQMSQQQQNGNGFMDVTRQPISPPDLISKGFDVSYRLGRRSFFSYA